MNWIKMRTDLSQDRHTISVTLVTGLSQDCVVGKLHRLWSWADANTADGFVKGVTAEWVDQFLGHPGFAAALVQVGWLVCEADGIGFPEWDRHMGQSAKRRAEAASRQRRHRESVTLSSHSERDNCVTREEKRREEKREVNPPSPPSASNGHHTGDPVGKTPPTTAETVTPSDRFLHRPETEALWSSLPDRHRRSKPRFEAEAIAAIGRGASWADLASAFARYFASDEGRGQFARSPPRLLSESFWQESQEAWRETTKVARKFKPASEIA